MPPALAFVHTSPVHVPTFTALLARLRPGAEATHVVDESLLQDARRWGPEAPAVVQRVQAAVQAAAGTGARVVVCTCSTIGAAAEATPTHGLFTAMRLDRAMADAAALAGPGVLVLAALPSTLAPTVALVRCSAQRLQVPVVVAEHVVAGAWALFEQGDLAAYCAQVSAAVQALLPGPDVVVLAQASMAPAAAWLRGAGVPVLCSPELGLRAALAQLPAGVA